MQMTMTDPKVKAAVDFMDDVNAKVCSDTVTRRLLDDIQPVQLVPVPIVNKDFTPLVKAGFEAANGEEDGVQAALDLQASHAVKEWDGE